MTVAHKSFTEFYPFWSFPGDRVARKGILTRKMRI